MTRLVEDYGFASVIGALRGLAKQEPAFLSIVKPLGEIMLDAEDIQNSQDDEPEDDEPDEDEDEEDEDG